MPWSLRSHKVSPAKEAYFRANCYFPDQPWRPSEGELDLSRDEPRSTKHCHYVILSILDTLDGLLFYGRRGPEVRAQ